LATLIRDNLSHTMLEGPKGIECQVIRVTMVSSHMTVVNVYLRSPKNRIRLSLVAYLITTTGVLFGMAKMADVCLLSADRTDIKSLIARVLIVSSLLFAVCLLVFVTRYNNLHQNSHFDRAKLSFSQHLISLPNTAVGGVINIPRVAPVSTRPSRMLRRCFGEPWASCSSTNGENKCQRH